VVEKIRPDECYHLAAQSFVSYSFEDEFSTISTNINGTHYVLSAIKEKDPKCKFYFAASSEMFGHVRKTPQTENTPFHPRSPYGISKVAGFDLTRNYREAYGLFACNGILFNHESPRRGFEFVTRKITSTVAQIKLGLAKELRIGNLEAKRDWGFAGDYVKAQWLMLQQDKPDDYVVATGETQSVREFLKAAFDYVDLDWKKYTKIDRQFYRPAEVHLLIGDYSKARRKLKWKPVVKFEQLVRMMVDADLERLK
jgi:GDPmannose 4,6-dehydratase